jgi:hypothetical protein
MTALAVSVCGAGELTGSTKQVEMGFAHLKTHHRFERMPIPALQQQRPAHLNLYSPKLMPRGMLIRRGMSGCVASVFCAFGRSADHMLGWLRSPSPDYNGRQSFSDQRVQAGRVQRQSDLA